MKKQVKEICKTIIKLKGFRHFSYFFIEIGFSSARFVLKMLNGPHLHQENPWRNSLLMNFLNKSKTQEDFNSWINYCKYLRNHLNTYEYQPKISILLPVYKPKARFLSEALESVLLQSYQNFELCIVDDGSQSAEIDAILEQFSSNNGSKVKYKKHEQNQHISAATNSCFAMATGDYITLLDHDDRLKPNALAELVRGIVLNNNPDILYSDEEVIDARGVVQGTVFKPGWSEFLHLTKNYTTHLSAYKKSLVHKLDGWKLGMEGAQDHDFMLRAVEATELPVAHIPISLYQWRAHESSTAQDGDSKPYAAIAGVKAVSSACERRGFPAKVDFEAKYFQYKIAPILPESLPLISIIILNKDAYEYISVCLESIFTHTTYSRFEVIVMDNGSTDDRCLELYKQYSEQHPEQFHFYSDADYFNFARLNNKGVEQANGEYVVFLNNDTEVLQHDWLEGLLGFAQLEHVGAVGCKLFYGNGPIQHAGIYGAGRNVGGHSGRLLSGDADLPLAINNCIHECLGVTAACLMISLDKFTRAGGLEETHAPNGFGDVLFGISLTELGLVNLFTPYVQLKHYESVSRGKNVEVYERNFLCEKYPKNLLMDKYYNINYSYNDHYIIDDNNRLADLPRNWMDIPFYL